MTVRSLFTLPDTRRRFMLLLACGATAFVVGFVLITPHVAEIAIREGGYYYMLALFATFVAFMIRVARSRREVWLPWLRRPGWVGVVLLAATGFTLGSDRYQHKVLFDEYVLQATGYQMHATKEVATVIRAYDFNHTWLSIDRFVDKRPYFFTFLLSLFHDLTGYRIVNVFILNSLLTAAFLGMSYWFARQLTNRAGGILAVLLLASLPLLGQNATGAGMEMHNLTMLMLEMCLGLLYLRAPDEDRLSLFCLGAVLLAQSRYESAIYVVPAAAVILVGWWRARRLVLSTVAIIAPLLLIPYAWHNRMVDAKPMLWQLGAGQTARFSTDYFPINILGSVRFFFNVTNAVANSWYLSVLGFAGIGWIAWWLVRRRAPAPLSPAAVVALAFGAGVAGNLVLIQFYYWSRLDDYVASRFALPSCLMLALAAAVLVVHFSRRWPTQRYALLGVGLFLCVSGLPAMAYRLYTTENLVMQEIDWERDMIDARPNVPRLVIANKSTIPWVLWRTPAVIIGVARQRGEQLKYHLEQGTFHEIIVSQALRPTTREGNFGVDPDDVLPDNFHLETIAIKRFGGRVERLSRLVAIDPPAPPAATERPAS